MEPKDWLKQKENLLASKQISRICAEAWDKEKQLLARLSPEEVFDYMISKLNFCARKQSYSYKDILSGIHLQKGDICFIDFGQAYLMETGYLHFGLILAFKHHKAFVVPMTGKAIRQSKSHLLILGEIPGLYKQSCLFLNDAKWINTARIIDIKGHVDPNSDQFQRIRKRVLECIGAIPKE